MKKYSPEQLLKIWQTSEDLYDSVWQFCDDALHRQALEAGDRYDKSGRFEDNETLTGHDPIEAINNYLQKKKNLDSAIRERDSSFEEIKNACCLNSRVHIKIIEQNHLLRTVL